MTREEFLALRELAGVSQEGFATSIGLVGKHRRQTVSRWELGREPISDRTDRMVRELMADSAGAIIENIVRWRTKRRFVVWTGRRAVPA